MARETSYNNFEISLVVFMPNINTNHAITYTNHQEDKKEDEKGECGPLTRN